MVTTAAVESADMECLNYRHLLYFWTVAEERSVSKAAALPCVAQPIVAAQLRSLARSLGQKLFERQGRSRGLAWDGEQVFRYADEMFSLGRELLQTVNGATQNASRRFRVGRSDSLPTLTGSVGSENSTGCGGDSTEFSSNAASPSRRCG